MINQWIIALSGLAIAVLLTLLIRIQVRKTGLLQRWSFIRELAPSIANVLYIIGLRLFADLAPLSGKVDQWFDGTVYVLSVILYLNLLLKASHLALNWSVEKAPNRETLQRGFIPLIRNIFTLFAIFSGVIMVLKHFHYDVMSLVTALGVGSFAVSLAAKETLANMISGFILIIDRNLRPGDRVNLNGMIGDVREIGLRSTQFFTGDGNVLIVPNADLTNNKLINLSMPNRQIARTTVIRVPASVPFEKVRNICFEVMNQVEKRAHDRAGWVNLSFLSDGNQTIGAGFWIAEMNDADTALTDFHSRILERFRNENIDLLGPPQPVIPGK